MRILKKSSVLAATVALAMSAAACSDSFFDVDRPNVVDAETIDPLVAAEEFANSAYQNFLVAYGGIIVYGGWFTNEGQVGDTFPTRNEFGRRSISARNSTLENEVWWPIARAMATTQEALEIMEDLPDKDSNPLVARAALAAGYTIQLMAESFCEGVIEPAGPAASTSEMLAKAVEFFQRAEAVAVAGNDTTMANAARVGLGRAYLQAGQKSEAAAAVADVDDDFVYNAVYFDDPANRGRLANNVYAFNTSRVSFVVGPEWRAMADEGDTRIGYYPLLDASGAHLEAQDGTLLMWVQTKYPSWGSPIRLASGLEARYIEVEASEDLDKIVDFVNARRAASGQPGTFTASDLDEAMMELMEQRGRDFWLEGKRLGDWRRHGAEDTFPYIIPSDGEYYKPEVGPMGNATCIPLTEFEKDANPSF